MERLMTTNNDDYNIEEEEYVENSDSYPYTELYPFRNIKTNEFENGVVWDWEKKRIWYRNSHPEFDKDAKFWNLIKVLKSTTSVVHWLIKMHKKYFVILQSRIYKLDDVCSIYESDSKGRYDNLNPIAIYQGYVDIESAADRFSQEYMAMLIYNESPEVSFLLKENQSSDEKDPV